MALGQKVSVAFTVTNISHAPVTIYGTGVVGTNGGTASPVVGIASANGSTGYYVVTANSYVQAGPMVGVASNSGSGYWTVSGSGAVHSEAASYYGGVN